MVPKPIMKRVVLVTAHYWDSKRKAGFHWIADAFWRKGWEVLFFTESISWLSWLRGDGRFQYPIFRQANRLRQVRERFATFVWFTPFHPGNLRLGLLNQLSRPLFARYGRLPLGSVEQHIAAADLIIFDSTHGLALVERFRKLNQHARFVYRVSDDIPMMKNHPLLAETEERVVSRFDLVSAPSEQLHRRFLHVRNAALHKHAIRKDLFDVPHPSPYRGEGPFVIYVGWQYFDHDFMARALRLFPGWSFHVFGAIPDLPSAPNLTAYGERPFAETVPYLRHANIGLQTRAYAPGAECLTDSLKMHQYTYCRLPIVAPTFLRNERPHVFYYKPGDDASIRQALLDARAFDRSRVPVDSVWSWDDLAAKLAA